MKKRTLWSVITVAVAVLVLGACGNKKSDDSVLKVGASPVPHAEILEHVKPLLEKEGVKLEVTTYTDYVLPNKALESGDIDANYFQHVPFFNEAVKENDYDFVNAGAIHLEPVGLFRFRLATCFNDFRRCWFNHAERRGRPDNCYFR